MRNKGKLVVEAIKNGTVIDHIPADRTLLVVEILTKPNESCFVGVNLSSTSVVKKGVVKIQDREFDKTDLKILAALAQDATVNIIRDYNIVSKKKLQVPSDVIDLFICGNTNCITNHQSVKTRFKLGQFQHTCDYCERSFPVHRLKVKRPDLNANSAFSQ
jgi:aspartate carbamoyltransferase regulatory subunit